MVSQSIRWQLRLSELCPQIKERCNFSISLQILMGSFVLCIGYKGIELMTDLANVTLTAGWGLPVGKFWLNSIHNILNLFFVFHCCIVVQFHCLLIVIKDVFLSEFLLKSKNLMDRIWTPSDRTADHPATKWLDPPTTHEGKVILMKSKCLERITFPVAFE